MCSNDIDAHKAQEYVNRLKDTLDPFNENDYTNIDYQVIQQLQLMLQILPEIIQTSQAVMKA